MTTNTLSIIALFFTCLLHTWNAEGQTVADFENFGLSPDSFLNNAGPDGSFSSGLVKFPNDYSPAFDAWQGWAISSMTDNQTPGYSNQYSSITGLGQDGSLTYAVAYGPSGTVIDLSGGGGKDVVCDGFYLTNSAYAYYSMRDGDAFAKKFGGATGDDPDFFRLTIKPFFGGNQGTDSIVVFLADYRFSDNDQDYILNTWQWVDLTPLGPADSLLFQLESSDVGIFGMNTPAYFCIDNFTTLDNVTSTFTKNRLATLKVYPNPTSGQLTVSLPNDFSADHFVISSLDGQLNRRFQIRNSTTTYDLSGLPSGTYIMSVSDRNHIQSTLFVIQ